MAKKKSKSKAKADALPQSEWVHLRGHTVNLFAAAFIEWGAKGATLHMITGMKIGLDDREAKELRSVFEALADAGGINLSDLTHES